MALDTYTALQTAVLGWLARPGDPLVAPAVPDMIQLFEAEANRRLRVVDAEKFVSLTVPPDGVMTLPSDCWGIRSVNWNGVQLEYRPPGSEVFWQVGGEPRFYSLVLYGAYTLYVGPSSGGTIQLIYQIGVPPLGPSQPVNWLLVGHADAYLFGTLAEAELYVGHDERVQIWLQRRDAAFASIEAYDRKTRWAGPMQIRAHGITATAAGASGGTGSTAPVVVVGEAAAAVRVVNPLSGEIVMMLAGERALYVEGGPRAALTIQLPPGPTPGMVEISFENPVTTLGVTDSGGVPLTEPTNAYGPGAGLQFRFVDAEWVFWK